jgi:hypothetical protein
MPVRDIVRGAQRSPSALDAAHTVQAGRWTDEAAAYTDGRASLAASATRNRPVARCAAWTER